MPSQTCSFTRWVTALFVAAAFSYPGDVHAACTALPEGSISYRSVYGSINRPFLRPGEAEDVIELRSACSPPLRDFNGDGNENSSDITITVVYRPPNGAPRHAVLISGDDRCKDLTGAFKEQNVESLIGSMRCFSGKEVNLEASRDSVRFMLPDTQFAGPVAIAVTAAGPKEPLPLKLANKRCREVIEEKLLDLDKLPFCIDEFFDSTEDPCIFDAAAILPNLSSLVVLCPQNDFASVCTRDLGHTPRCKGDAVSLCLTVDEEGDVLIPMHWSKILRSGPAGTGLQGRWVGGSSTVPAALSQLGPIDVPSAAFLESTNGSGGRFSPEPLFLAVELSDRPNELNLFGTADKGYSVLRLKRRRFSKTVCTGSAKLEKACEPEPKERKDLEDCPGSPAPGCAEALADLTVFTCKGGGRDGLPCSRPHHCKNLSPGGTSGVCSSGAVCTLSGKMCQTDGECSKGVNTCGTNGTCTISGNTCTVPADCPKGRDECGKGLFEFRDRLQPMGKFAIERAVPTGVTGVCDEGSPIGQACVSPTPCPNGAACVGFRAEAGFFVP